MITYSLHLHNPFKSVTDLVEIIHCDSEKKDIVMYITYPSFQPLSLREW